MKAYFSPAPPRVLAHRGLAIGAPENTLLAFARALAVGVSHLETDVHGSSDGVAIISHDPDLRRIADRGERVSALTLRELHAVHLGEGQVMCSLAEALDGFPGATFNIDIKSADAVAPTIDAVRDARALDRVLITSFSTSRRRATVSGLPGVATSASAAEAGRAIAAARFGTPGMVRAATRGIDALQIPSRFRGIDTAAPRTIRRLQDAGIEVHYWTIDDPAEMTRLLDAGADGIVTNRADLAQELIAARS